MAWKLAKMAMNKKCVINGTDLFTLEWTDTGTVTNFKDPIHAQKTDFPIYEAEKEDGEKIRFAYKEVMPGKHVFLTEG